MPATRAAVALALFNHERAAPGAFRPLVAKDDRRWPNHVAHVSNSKAPDHTNLLNQLLDGATQGPGDLLIDLHGGAVVRVLNLAYPSLADT